MENRKLTSEEKEIDLGEVLKYIQKNKSQYLKIVIGFMVIALAATSMLPEKFSSTAIVRAKAVNTGISSSMAEMAAMVGIGNIKSNTASYMELMQSRSVIEPIIDKTETLSINGGIKRYKLVDKFIKEYLKFENPKGTDLIKITATSKKPEEAQMIAQGVVENMAVTLANVNQSGQSSYRKFLEERIKIADQEMKEAEANLEEFKQKSKVFVPNEQASGIIEQLTELDKNIAKEKVYHDTKLKKLELLDNGEAATIYNSDVMTATTEVRQALVEKEIALKSLQQKYTDKHPEVIQIKKEISELKNKVRLEVNTEIASSEVRLNTLNEQKAAIENKISQLSIDSIEYIELSRKVETKREIYGLLIKNMETARIQEAMNSMDLQVIDNANLPLYKTQQPKMIVTAACTLLGILCCMAHAVWKVSK